MFERFTDKARHVVVLAQEEARDMHHNYIGTEHLLLGLLREPRGVAAKALDSLGITLADTRAQVTARVGTGKKLVTGHIPFTPRAKKVLELGLREALALHHNYIGTEHLLLGVIREGEGVGAQVLAAQVDDLLTLRMAVLDLVPPGEPALEGRRWLRRARPFGGRGGETSEPAEIRTTAAADISLDEAARLAGTDPVGSHHLLLAALGDPNTAAAKVLATLGVDLDQARAALRDADVAGTSDEQPEDAGRRQMTLRVTADRLSIEATDPRLLELARSAVNELEERGGDPGVIRGDAPIGASLGGVWRAIANSLEDIRRRAEATRARAEDPDVPDPSTG